MVSQPKDYSEMLKCIFWSSLVVGILCSLSLGCKSPAINKFLNSLSKEWDLGPLTLPLISVVIPLFIAILTRMITLHDKISDLFKIREKFDLKYILLHLSKGVNFRVDQEMMIMIRGKKVYCFVLKKIKIAKDLD